MIGTDRGTGVVMMICYALFLLQFGCFLMELAIRNQHVQKKTDFTAASDNDTYSDFAQMEETMDFIRGAWCRRGCIPFRRKNDSVSFLDSYPDHSRNCRGNLEYGALLSYYAEPVSNKGKCRASADGAVFFYRRWIFAAGKL